MYKRTIVFLLFVLSFSACGQVKNVTQPGSTIPSNSITATGAKLTPAQREKTGLVVEAPSEKSIIRSPLNITGYVNGENWVGFEGTVGRVELQDGSGTTLATAPLTATEDWTQVLVPFSATLIFGSVTTQSGALIFYNENPSGLPVRDKVEVQSVSF